MGIPNGQKANWLLNKGRQEGLWLIMRDKIWQETATGQYPQNPSFPFLVDDGNGNSQKKGKVMGWWWRAEACVTFLGMKKVNSFVQTWDNYEMIIFSMIETTRKKSGDVIKSNKTRRGDRCCSCWCCIIPHNGDCATLLSLIQNEMWKS